METNNLPAVQTQSVSTFNFFDKEQFETMQRVCKLFASSELVPDMYKTDLTVVNGAPKNPEHKAMANCMIAIEMAQRIGASPLMIMQNMVIIYGRPSWSSKFLIATVNTCGRFNPLQYKITNLGRVGKVPYTDYVWDGKKKAPVTKEYDGTNIENLQCIAFTTAKGSTEVLESSPIDIKMAIQEGWYTKSGSKWVTMTRQMLMYRAASFWTSAYAPELSMGMKTDDELHDIIDVDYEDVTVQEKVKKEMADNANKKTISMDDPQPEKQPEQPAVDTHAQPTQENAPQATGQPAEPAKKVGEAGLFAGTAADAAKAKQPERGF
jgi:hypothetical protein